MFICKDRGVWKSGANVDGACSSLFPRRVEQVADVAAVLQRWSERIIDLVSVEEIDDVGRAAPIVMGLLRCRRCHPESEAILRESEGRGGTPGRYKHRAFVEKPLSLPGRPVELDVVPDGVLVVETCAGADHCFAAPSGIPRDADLRREIQIRLADLLPQDWEAWNYIVKDRIPADRVVAARVTYIA